MFKRIFGYLGHAPSHSLVSVVKGASDAFVPLLETEALLGFILANSCFPLQGARAVSKGARQGVGEAASTSGSGEPQKADAQQPDLMAESQSYLQACHRQPGESRTSARRRLLKAEVSSVCPSGL